jgi:hypothetical protein
MKRRKALYTARCLHRDIMRQCPWTRDAAADVLRLITSHLRVAAWQYETIDVLGLGVLELRCSQGGKPRFYFHADTALLAEIEAIWSRA